MVVAELSSLLIRHAQCVWASATSTKALYWDLTLATLVRLQWLKHCQLSCCFPLLYLPCFGVRASRVDSPTALRKVLAVRQCKKKSAFLESNRAFYSHLFEYKTSSYFLLFPSFLHEDVRSIQREDCAEGTAGQPPSSVLSKIQLHITSRPFFILLETVPLFAFWNHMMIWPYDHLRPGSTSCTQQTLVLAWYIASQHCPFIEACRANHDFRESKAVKYPYQSKNKLTT